MSSECSRPARVSDLGHEEFLSWLSRGLPVKIGPFRFHIRVDCPEIADPLRLLYSDFPLVPPGSVFSARVHLEKRTGLSQLRRRKVRFSVDGVVPHEDMPADHALAVLEWGINLVVALRFQRYLMLHAAALERHGYGMLLPGAPGFGKSTLCAGLALNGWRLLSDEFGLLRPHIPDLIPIPRPIALKNESIDVIRSFSDSAVLGPDIRNTRKGTVAHLKPPQNAIDDAHQFAPVKWIVFPRWEANAACVLSELPKSYSFMQLASNSFNYELLGEDSFKTVRNVIETADCFELTYSSLPDAISTLEAHTEHDAQ